MVGINTAVAGVGLGLAIPINRTTRHIIAALMADGRVRRAYLGVAGGPVPLPPPVAERLDQRTGLRVVEVVPRQPGCAGRAARPVTWSSGARRTPILAAQDLQRLMLADAIGQDLAITVLRSGAMVDVVAHPTELRLDD